MISNKYIKKAISICICLILILSFSPLVFANEGFGYTVDSREVRLSQDGTADFDIHVINVDVFAGAQFELILSDGVSIEDISFSNERGSGTIPPTHARGSYFFSLISGTNEFEGDFICTVSILYEGTENAQIIIAEIQTHFIESPGNVETTVNDVQTVITVLPFEFWIIEDVLTPLAFLRQHWLWFVIAAAAVVFTTLVFVIIRQQRKIKAMNALAAGDTIDKSENEADAKKPLQKDTSGNSSGDG